MLTPETAKKKLGRPRRQEEAGGAPASGADARIQALERQVQVLQKALAAQVEAGVAERARADQMENAMRQNGRRDSENDTARQAPGRKGDDPHADRRQQTVQAGREVVNEALAHVRPHAQGDLWRRWATRWPWLIDEEAKEEDGRANSEPRAAEAEAPAEQPERELERAGSGTNGGTEAGPGFGERGV